MKAIKYLTLFSLLFFLFFISPSPILASNCGEVPPSPYDGPQFYLPTDTNSTQCSLPSKDRQVQELELADVDCVDNPGLVADALNFDTEYLTNALVPKLLTGKNTIQFVNYDGFGLNNDTLSSISPELVSYLSRAINIPDYFDPTIHDALCVYEGYTTRSTCTAFLKTQSVTGKENLMASSGWLQRATSLETQFNQKKVRANQIIKCVEGNAASTDPCDQIYVVNKAKGLNSYQLAQQIAAMDYVQFREEPEDFQMTALSLRESRALSGVYLVVINTNPQKDNFLVNLVSDVKGTTPYITQTSYLPGVYKSKQGAETLYRMMNKKSVADEGLARINQKFYTDLDDTKDMGKLLFDKVNLAKEKGLNCADQVSTYQSMGSQAEHLVQNPVPFSLNLQLISDWISGLKTPPKDVYEAYVVAPTGIMEQLMAGDQQAALPQMVKSQYQQSAQAETYLPQDLTRNPTEISTGKFPAPSGTTIVEVPCKNNPDELCPSPAPNIVDGQISFSSQGKKVEGPLPGGGVTNFLLYLKGKLAWKKGSPEHYSTTCYANELATKTNTGILASLGTNLFNLLGRTSSGSLSNCPPEMVAATLNDSPGIYGQCSAESVRSEIAGAISSAAAKYSVPESLLQAIYEIEALDGIIVETKPYQCQENSFGAAGPFQIVKSTYNNVTCTEEQIENDIGLCSSPGSSQLSRCDVNDAAELSARILLSKVGKWSGCAGGGNLSVSRPTEIYNAAWRYYGSDKPDNLTIELGKSLNLTNANYGDIVCAKMGISCPH